MDRNSFGFTQAQLFKTQKSSKSKRTEQLKQLGFTTSWSVTDKKRNYNALEDPYANRYFNNAIIKSHIRELRRSLSKQERNTTEKRKLDELLKAKLKAKLPAVNDAVLTYHTEGGKDKKGKLSIKKSSNSKFRNQYDALRQNTEPEFRSTNIYTKNKTVISPIKSKPSPQKCQIRVSQDIQTMAKPQNSRKTQQIQQTQQSRIQTGDSHSVLSSKINGNLKNSSSQKKTNFDREKYYKRQKQLLHQKKRQEFLSFIAKKKEMLDLAFPKKK